jgi:hypothetical protein
MTLSAEFATYHFSVAELDRLMIYRLAVAAGLFTDELDAPSSVSVRG